MSRQSRIDEFVKRDECKCPVCGRAFDSVRACNIHISKSHFLESPLVSPGEGVTVSRRGSYTYVTIKMRSTRWMDIMRRAKEVGATVEELLFDAIGNLQAFGNDYELWETKLGKTATIGREILQVASEARAAKASEREGQPRQSYIM